MSDEPKVIDTGGPAFSGVKGFYNAQGTFCMNGSHEGMTLRDWYAGKALTGRTAASIDETPEDCAKWCHKYADAMIAARKL